MKALNLRLDDDLDHQIRVLAAHRDMARSEFARLMLRERVGELNWTSGVSKTVASTSQQTRDVDRANSIATTQSQSDTVGEVDRS